MKHSHSEKHSTEELRKFTDRLSSLDIEQMTAAELAEVMKPLQPNLKEVYYNVWGQDGFSYDTWGDKCFRTKEEAEEHCKARTAEERDSDIPNHYWVTENNRDCSEEYYEGGL